MMYHVRINGQTIGPLDDVALVQRSSRWQTQYLAVEVAPVGSQTFISLDQFLAQRKAVLPSPYGSVPAPASVTAAAAGKYDVKVNGQLLGPLARVEIEQRAAGWLTLKTAIEVAPAGTLAFMSLDSFLRSPVASPTPALSGTGMYDTRINGQMLGPFRRDELEARAPRWKKLGAVVEVADAGSLAFVPLDHFLKGHSGVRTRLGEFSTRIIQTVFIHPVRALVVSSAVLVTVMAIVFLSYLGWDGTGYITSWIPFLTLSEEQRWTALSQGNAYFEAENYQEAIAAFERLIRRAPDFKQAHAARGHALVAAQRYQDAIAAYTKAIEIDRDYAGPYLGRGWTQWFIGQVAAAADDYRQLVRLEPDNANFHLELERVLYELDRPGEVAELWAEYFRRNPDVSNARIWQARALAKAEDWSTLRRELSEGIGRQPFSESAYMQYLYGRALNETRAHREAITPLRRAVELVRSAKTLNKSLLREYGDELFFTYIWAGDVEAARQWEQELRQQLQAS